MVDLNLLNPQQRLAVETCQGPVLILAGAGTGKTRVITYRIAHLMKRGVAPGNILAVTFTNKAAREMKERVSELAPRASRINPAKTKEDLTISTFHSLCVRILRQFIDRLGYKNNFVIYDETEQVGVIRKILSHISIKGEKVDPRLVLSLLSRYKNAGPDSPKYASANAAVLAEHVSRRYETALHACNAVDFDDLILLTLKLFREHPDTLAACRARFLYVMVDEYQDTNAAQFELIHLLTCEHRHLCVVGDDDQSIYGWRGAAIANLLDFEKHYPEVRVIKLEQNYRSTATILQAANAVIQHNPRRRGKQLWSNKGQGEKILLYAFADEDEEARPVVENLECDRLARGIPWSAQAVLFRTNQQSRPLETALRQAGVRYHLIGGQSFFDRREIRDLLAYLKVMVNPHDDNSLLRIANVPARGLSEVTMERLLAASHEHHCSVFNAMRVDDIQENLPTRAREAMKDFIRFIENTRAPLLSTPDLSLPQWAEGFLTESGYLAELRRSEKDSEAGENRVRNLKDLILTMESDQFGQGSPLERLQIFLEDLMLDNERAEEKEKEGEAVTLITMHSCKGLEFPHVHIVGLEEGLLPHARSKEEGTLDEERRLFYVAMTRAMKTLTLSHCQARKKFGKLTPCHPSSFLSELPPDLVEPGDVKASQPVAVETGKNLFAAVRAAVG